MVQAYQEGKFLAEPDMRGKPRPNPMSDPAAMEGMMGMMKGNMAMMVPQTLIMGWINAFFSGFVISKFTPDVGNRATGCLITTDRLASHDVGMQVDGGYELRRLFYAAYAGPSRVLPANRARQ